jgi:hypothetical protein
LLEHRREEKAMKSLLWLLAVGPAPLAVAHEGHGLSGAHWHAGDAFGFAVLGLAMALAVWASRRK